MDDRVKVDGEIRFNDDTGKFEAKVGTSRWTPLSHETGRCPVCDQFCLNIRDHVRKATDEEHAVLHVMED